MIIPHDEKRHRGGEDSADSNDYVLSVADGVGGWALRGVNPGLYSMELTRSLVEFAELDPTTSIHELIFNACNHAASQYQGTATAVALKLLEDLKIEGANLGDSGYALFHLGENDTIEMYFRSPSQ